VIFRFRSKLLYNFTSIFIETLSLLEKDQTLSQFLTLDTTDWSGVLRPNSDTAIFIPYGAVRIVGIFVFLGVLIISIIVGPVWFRRSVRG